ncbi:uncharacterized protein VNE69_03321 [Vairimorpha necatrix]|uniref:Uncharacterized protein n=1 Tax=Vairimorpha necatrix TaxID=6039 RepID=A0AAX4JAY4_9MICR
MYFHILTAFCSDVFNSKSEATVSTNENHDEIVENKTTSICHRLLIKENMINNAKENVPNSENLRFQTYKTIESFLECASSFDLNQAHVLSVVLDKTEENYLKNNIQLNIDQDIAKYLYLLTNLGFSTCCWNSIDFYIEKSSVRLKISNEDDHNSYRNLQKSIYYWTKNPSIIINEFLEELSKLIFNSKINEKAKILLFYQLQYCYEAMDYIHKLLPFRENRKTLSTELLFNYIHLTQRLPLLLYNMNLQEVFQDFFKLVNEHFNEQDPVCVEIIGLVKELSDRLNITYNGVSRFIETISAMSKILEKAEHKSYI